ncbi:flavin reductase [Ruminococcaceae bacterium OttesenSCG-928-D13]|nr:flavin reductase [Ruminococcaceae bacterium OttesenSCG-928-D13]
MSSEMHFKTVNPGELKDNFFERIGTDWMLVCAGTPDNCNAMTASWGQVGVLWNKPVATCFVRPQRHTYGFVEAQARYSLSFFAPGEKRQELGLMGSKSGRDGDKIAEAGLTVAGFGPENVPGFESAALVLVCRKLYRQDMTGDSFVEPGLVQTHYPKGDFHRVYVGEIEAVFTRE